MNSGEEVIPEVAEAAGVAVAVSVFRFPASALACTASPVKNELSVYPAAPSAPPRFPVPPVPFEVPLEPFASLSKA